MASLSRSTRFSSRTAAVAALLVLTLGLILVLAYQAFDASRSHRQMAERTLKEHAHVAAWELSSVLRREIYSQLLAPGFEVVAKGGGVYPEVPLKDPRSLKELVADFGWWPAGNELDFIFRYPLEGGPFVFTGEVSPKPATQEWITALLKEMAEPDPRVIKRPLWSMAFHGTGASERMVAMALGFEVGSGNLVGYGFQLKPSALRSVLLKIEKGYPLLPPALTGGRPSGEILSFSITSGAHRLIYQSTPEYKSSYFASDTLGQLFGGLVAGVGLRPEAAESLVIGGLPGSRLPLILGLLVLASGLVIAALFQIRREQELSLLRTDFVSSVSHQLRTPLAQIRMFGETLLLGRVRSEEERKRSLEIIVKESRRLTHQVDNVLLFSRAQRQDVRLNPEPLVLTPLIRDTLESFCPLAEAQDCTVEADLQESLTAVVDPVAFKQILLNLLENAVKYGPRDQIIDVRLEEGAPGMVRLLVEDEGEGIPPDQREAVFSPYARLERDRDSGVAGSGIGLAVVQELVLRQGGTVRVEGAASGGARLVVELPQGPASVSDSSPTSQPARAGKQDTPSPAKETITPAPGD